MVQLANAFPVPNDLEQRALNQAARELLLAQASDWAFIMKTGTVVQYAVQRTKEHLLRFTQLYEMLHHRAVHKDWLTRTEQKDNIFPNLNYRLYRSDYHFAPNGNGRVTHELATHS